MADDVKLLTVAQLDTIEAYINDASVEPDTAQCLLDNLRHYRACCTQLESAMRQLEEELGRYRDLLRRWVTFFDGEGDEESSLLEESRKALEAK